MVNLRCNDYGYQCEYISEGEIDEVVENYRGHMNTENLELTIQKKVYWNSSKEKAIVQSRLYKSIEIQLFLQ